ncbi:DUF222 domain-containing protein [Kribbella sp. NPDC058245]|uniref:DUF222 domain-containing protein n=1 Tax=Kribbella sp. NPDC058245 TaxID=3346399 RepID=UPI0036E4C375
MEILAMRPVCMQSDSELLVTLDTLETAEALIKTAKLQVIADLHDRGTAQALGARDTVELVSQRYRLNPADVRKDVTFSGALGKYSAVVDALPDPTDPARPAVLDPALAKVIVTTLEKAPASVPVDQLEVAEEQMINAARISNPRELTKFGLEVLARLDTDGAEPAEDEARAKESLRVRQVDGGVKFSGFVAGASGETLLTQLHALSKPHKTVDGERDPRPLEVRQVDGFKTILDAAAGNPDYPGVPHITVTIDFNDLKTQLGTVTEAAGSTTPTPTPTPATTDGAAATGSTTTPGTTGGVDAPGATAAPNMTGTRRTSGSARTSGVPGPSGAAGTSGVPGATGEVGTTDTAGAVGAVGAMGAMGTTDTTDAVGVLGLSGAGGELVLGGNLSASAVRLLACDAAILPIVLGGDSQPLDVGTEQRFVNRYIRRALNKRDKGCVVCQAPPWMCHAHHLIHWADGGPTSLQNLALLCSAHHRAVHAGQWAVSITSSGLVEVTRPDWADPPLTDPADLAAVFAWATPAQNDNDSVSDANSASASGGDGDGDGDACSDAGVGGAGFTSDPVHWPPDRLPTASTVPNPELAAAREAFRARLLSLTPNYRDPWADDTPAAGP